MTEDAQAYISCARAAAERNELHRAADHYVVALRFEPGSLPALCGLVDIHLRQGELGEARRVLARALEIDEEHPRVLKVQAELHARTGRFDAAAKSIHLAAEIDSYKRRFRR